MTHHILVYSLVHSDNKDIKYYHPYKYPYIPLQSIPTLSPQLLFSDLIIFAFLSILYE